MPRPRGAGGVLPELGADLADGLERSLLCRRVDGEAPGSTRTLSGISLEIKLWWGGGELTCCRRDRT